MQMRGLFDTASTSSQKLLLYKMHTTKLTFFCYSHFRFRFSFQYWMLSKTGEIRRDEACLDYAGSDVILYPCHGSKGNQFWTYDHQVCILNLSTVFPHIVST